MTVEFEWLKIRLPAICCLVVTVQCASDVLTAARLESYVGHTAMVLFSCDWWPDWK